MVITGLSGSGKSSLAFDTIYAEGQRRYIETFSAYARQFLGGLERPDVDKIDGLSPVIAIEQKPQAKAHARQLEPSQKFMISCVCSTQEPAMLTVM